MPKMHHPQKIWQKVLNSLEVDLSPAVFSTFLKTTEAAKYENNIVTILTKDHYQKENLELRYYGQIKAMLDSITGSKNEIIFKVGLKKSSGNQPLGPLFEKEKPEARNQRLEADLKQAGLAPFYTFDNFIVAANNNIAHAIARAIVDNPGHTYNPFFIYSGVGLGKTHLVQAIGNAIVKKQNGTKVLYCTGESFMNEFLEALTEGRKQSFLFRKKFRAADVWIIDDVQFIAGRESTQEEFFNTFNTLYQDKKQVIMASDRPPKEITKLEERLSSRFSAGMIARLDPPDLETRIAILRHKREETKYEVDNSILEAIAQAVTSNIRELEGAFLQVVSSANASGKPLDKRLVCEILGINAQEKSLLTPKKAIGEVSRKYDILIKDLKGQSRKAEIAMARQICMYLLRTECRLPLESIGALLGGRDHTTIIHGIAKIEKLKTADGAFAKEIHNLSTDISRTF